MHCKNCEMVGNEQTFMEKICGGNRVVILKWMSLKPMPLGVLLYAVLPKVERK